MTWNLERFRNLCVAKNLPDSRVYQNTLVWEKELGISVYHSTIYNALNLCI